jgi:hypothetical protein
MNRGLIKAVRVAITPLASPVRAFRNCQPGHETIDPDRWLERVNGQAFVRKVQSNANVTINHEQYYVPRELVGLQVTCFINAPAKQFEIGLAGSHVKSVPIKGLCGRLMPFEEYVLLMKQEARSEYQRYLQTHSRLVQGRLWA